MPEKELPSPFRVRQSTEEPTIPEEIKAVLGIYELTRRLRAKNPDDPKDIDKTPEDMQESAGDHIAMCAYLMHYFLPILEQSGKELNYRQTLDMVLAHEMARLHQPVDVPGIHKTIEKKREELIATAKVFGTLPERGGFSKELFDAYAEYLAQRTSEARFVRGLNGLSTMLYILCKPEHMRRELVAGRGYTLGDYRKRIGVFCEDFPPLKAFYDRIERLFHVKKYFASSSTNGNGQDDPEVMRRLFVENKPHMMDSTNPDPDAENMKLLQFFRLKRRLRFEQSPKPANEQHDTDAEHIASALFLARYLVPACLADDRQEGKQDITLRDTIETLLAHDAPEALTGDRISQVKTEKDTVEERRAAAKITETYAPRAAGANQRFGERFALYELSKTPSPVHSSATLTKAIDVLEGQFYIYDPETREKLSHMRTMSREKLDEKVGRFIRLFPVVNAHYEALNKRFKQEGIH